MFSLTVAGQRRTLTGFAFSALASGPWAPLTFDIQLPTVYNLGRGLSKWRGRGEHPKAVRPECLNSLGRASL